MTISNTQTITKADLDGSFSMTTLQSRKSAALIAAGCHQVSFDWDGIASSTSSTLLAQTYTVGDDDQEVLAFGGYVDGTSATYSITLTGPLVESMTVNLTSSTGDLSRYDSDGTKPLQVLLRGATYTLTASCSTASGTNRLRGFLVLRTRPRKR